MRLFLTALLSIRLAVSGVYSLDCSTNGCFGRPQGCVADDNCRVVFKFDAEDNLDLYLRNFDDKEYAAMPIAEDENDTTTYFICLPHSQLRLQATARVGEPITVSENQMARTVRKIGENNFVCSFSSVELPNGFRNQQQYFVKTGEFVDNLLIEEGEPLYSLNTNNDEDEDADYEPIYTEPISGTIKRTTKLTNDVYTSEESEKANNAIDAIQNIADKDDSDLEDIELAVGKKRGQKKRTSRQEQDDEDEDVEEEDTYTTRRPTRGNRKSSKSPRSSNEDDDEDWEDEATQIEKKNKKSRKSHRHQYDDEEQERRPTRGNRRRYQEDDDEEELPNKRSKSRRQNDEQDEDEEEEDEGFYDDEDDSAYANLDIFLCSSIIIIVFGFIF